MSNRLVVTIVVLFACQSSSAQDAEPPKLWRVELQRIDPLQGIFHQIRYSYVTMETSVEKRTYTVGALVKTYTATVCTPRQKERWVQLTTRNYQILDAAGKPVDPTKIWSRLRDGLDVYRSSTPEVSPEQLQGLSRDDLILAPRPAEKTAPDSEAP